MRSDCASTQSDQQFCGSLLRCIIPIVAKPSFKPLAGLCAEQTGLSLTWSHTTEDRFSLDEARIKLVLMRAITLSM